MARVNETSRSSATSIIDACLWMPNQPLTASSRAPRKTTPKPRARRVATFRLTSFMSLSVGIRVSGVGGGLIDELHVLARHESCDVGEDQHPLAERAEAGDEARVDIERLMTSKDMQ